MAELSGGEKFSIDDVEKTIHLTIVSAEQSIYDGEVTEIYATGSEGELGVLPGHTPLITTLQPGQVRAVLPSGEEEIFYISGGVIEVQPREVTVLSDTALRAADIDEAAALAAQKNAEEALQHRDANFEYSKAAAELARAVAQLRALKKLRKK